MGRVTPPAAKRAYNYRYRYRLEMAEHDALLQEQQGLCALCGEAPKGRRRLCVDHDHDSGRVRALLCIGCNVALGHLENPVWFANATDYLKRHHPERYLD